jgi:hypothetical protein
MTDTTSAERPDWQVLAVIDDDGHEAAFAYTIGLHEGHDLPELQCPARPAAGAGPDYVLSPRDLGHLLNDCARRCVTGELGPGSRLELAGDEGRTLLVFRLGAPGPLEAAQAFQAHPDASVIPIGWELVEC